MRDAAATGESETMHAFITCAPPRWIIGVSGKIATPDGRQSR
jgi:hypothetical protein